MVYKFTCFLIPLRYSSAKDVLKIHYYFARLSETTFHSARPALGFVSAAPIEEFMHDVDFRTRECIRRRVIRTQTGRLARRSRGAVKHHTSQNKKTKKQQHKRKRDQTGRTG